MEGLDFIMSKTGVEDQRKWVGVTLQTHTSARPNSPDSAKGLFNIDIRRIDEMEESIGPLGAAHSMIDDYIHVPGDSALAYTSCGNQNLRFTRLF